MNQGKRSVKATHMPLIGIAASLVLFFVSAAYYPGGTYDSPNSTGYDWARNFISTLFAPRALNGAHNAARYYAIPAMLFFSASIAVMFKSISRKGSSKFHAKAIEIAGIGSAVYTFLIVTPMHDLLVSIALVFFLVALLVTLRLLYAERYLRLFGAGIACLALLLLSTAMYYGNWLF